jgi:malonyl-CoA decarboxylase
LIKQVVIELNDELPSVTRFATLSPVPGFAGWLKRLENPLDYLRPEELSAIAAEFGASDLPTIARHLAEDPGWVERVETVRVLEAPLKRLCARYLTAANGGKGPSDPVARFHLRNGARLERINWLANPSPRGVGESFGLMVNYLYDLDRIEANHEGFVRDGEVARSSEIVNLLRDEGAGLGVSALLGLGGGRRVTPSRANP